jgi:hypothetical protein
MLGSVRKNRAERAALILAARRQPSSAPLLEPVRQFITIAPVTDVLRGFRSVYGAIARRKLLPSRYRPTSAAGLPWRP